jgi:phosphatidylserine decarboxylase
VRFARESLPFVAPLVLLAVLLAAAGAPRWAVTAAILALAVLLFFRVPARRSAAPADAVLAPANGVVTRIDGAAEPSLGDGPQQRIVTFLSVFDVHVQRAPVGGKVVASRFTPGRKVAAFRADAGEINENHWTVLETSEGRRFGVRQIAGLLARRVVNYAAEGRSFGRGDLIGLIKFGSRVDLYVPGRYRVTVTPGQRLVEGRTVVALPPDDEDAT